MQMIRGLGVLTVAVAAALGLSVSLATAQTNYEMPTHARAARQATDSICGASISSRIKTQNTAAVFSNTGFQVIPGAATPVSVPSGSRCIVVRFTAGAACQGSGVNYCYVRAIISGGVGEMFPQGLSLQTFVSEDESPEAHAYIWTRRLQPGNYTIFIQQRVNSLASDFYLDDWTFEVEVRG
jgi:hypothetical protein